ncbi:MAG: HDOD domain-containing protein [Gammaproteobacteria bacterium]|nr:MAG: HDOD domain-containing protein [Gammaproteobacteria bacterium]
MSAVPPRLPDARTAASLPGVSVEVIDLMRTIGAAEATASEISDALSRDLTLTARVLKVVNSAYYGQSRTIASVERAVVVLGFPAVRSIAMAAGCFRLRRMGSAVGGISPESLLSHGLAVALASRQLARHREGLCREEAFMAGLLHDFGLMLEMHGSPAEFSDLAERMQSEDASGPHAWLALEAELFGRSHGHSAAVVFAEWQLPERIVGAVASHHAPLRADGPLRELAAVVALADSLAADAGLGFAGASEPMVPEDSLLEYLGFDWAERAGLQDDIRSELSGLQRILGDDS